MSLRFERCNVRSAGLGDSGSFAEGHLRVDPEALQCSLVARDSRIVSAEVHVVCPAEDTRILCCKDVVQPRHKVTDDAPGSGVVRVLNNVAVVTCGPIVGFQEGIIDMSGPGAAYSPFSALFLIVLELKVVSGLSPHEHESVVREAGTAAAELLAETGRGVQPDVVEELLWDEIEADKALPRIAYLDMMLSQGLLHDTYLLGQRVSGEAIAGGLPCMFDPRVLLDNGVISGNCVSACDKNTTFHHQNNPIIRHLLQGHGSRWNFVGVVATNIPTRLAEKERSAARAVELTLELNADGAIVSKEGFGNPDADLMMLVRGLEQAGVRCVALTDEFAGGDGASQSLADVTPEADAVISTGNANQRISLAAMTRTIGPLPDVARLAGGYAGNLKPDGTLEVELQAMMGATNEFGFGRLRCRGI